MHLPQSVALLVKTLESPSVAGETPLARTDVAARTAKRDVEILIMSEVDCSVSTRMNMVVAWDLLCCSGVREDDEIGGMENEGSGNLNTYVRYY